MGKMDVLLIEAKSMGQGLILHSTRSWHSLPAARKVKAWANLIHPSEAFLSFLQRCANDQQSLLPVIHSAPDSSACRPSKTRTVSSLCFLNTH